MKMNQVLIVDDNAENLYLLRTLLQGNGYEVVTATHGADALDIARQNPPDLIIADILMPVMDGFALCREWKKDERLKPIPFVFYTATYTDERDREFALSLGAERFIVKPVEPDAFMAIIRETIQQAGSPPAARAKPAEDAPTQLPIEAPEEEKAVYLKQYNEVLIRKLEAKMEQLEQANRELEQNITERKQVEKLLTKSEQDLRILSSQLITSQEDERQRVAMELHDDISSKLASIKFSLERNLIQPPDAIDQRNKLSKDVIDTVKDVMNSIRRIMANLRPSLIDDLGLLPTIAWYCREFPKTYDAATIEKELDINEEEITDNLKIVIFRIIQEAMNNIAKHSQADQVRLSLKRIEGAIELLVEDNGQGFDVEKRNTDPGEYKGFGLTGMKVRIRHSGGTFSIESLKGKGTVIRATWPNAT